MLQLSVQTIMPISDGSMAVSECQAAYEVSGKPQKVFAQCLLGTPALSVLCPHIFLCWLLSPAAGASPSSATRARQMRAGEGSQEGPRQPETAPTWEKEPFS